MTETQAKSGTAGASNAPVDEEAAGGGAPATGRAAVGRAAVPADAPSPKFTRAPGMPPPPDQPASEPTEQPAEAPETAQGADATVPVSKPSAPTPGKVPGAGQKPATTPDGGRPVGAEATRAMPAGAGRPGQPGATRPVSGGPVPGRPGVGGAAAVGAARVSEAVRAARSTVNSAASRGPRRARLNLKRIDPWSVMKFSAAVSVVLFIVVIVATSVLYLALDAMGVFKSVNSSLTDLIAGAGQSSSSLKITAKGVIGTSALIGLVNVVLFTALATLGAFIYNVCADLVGGIELTLAERD
jgi:hypothetical protein